MADSNLVKLARFLNRRNYSCDNEQQAIWSISDKRSIAGIASDDEPLMSLRQFLADMKGITLPWYTLETRNYVFSNGRIVSYVTSLTGEMNYSNEKENYVTCTVLNENGLPVILVKSQWLGPTVNSKYPLDLPVAGLAAGKYKVELRSPEKLLASRDFEL